MVNIAQTIAVVVAALVSAYAVAAAEINRRLSVRRTRVERLLEAVEQLAEAAIRVQEQQGQGPALEVARMRLRMQLALTGVRGFEGTDLLIRDTIDAPGMVRQSEVAILEIDRALNELTPRPLVAAPLRWLRRRRQLAR